MKLTQYILTFGLSLLLLTETLKAGNLSLDDKMYIAPECNIIQAERLQKAYPSVNLRIESAENGDIYLHLKGKTLLFCKPTEGIQLNAADENLPLVAMLHLPYPKGAGGRQPRIGFDPGRVRNTEWLKILYGSNSEEVQHNSEFVDFFGQRLLFNTKQGAAAALKRVVKRLNILAQTNPSMLKYLVPSAGTFNWRQIQGTERLSAHAFAIAIDLNTEYGLYWQWNPSEQLLRKTRDTYPQDIIDAFESEGFIWGGKWSAFDLMHFEYRPELL